MNKDFINSILNDSEQDALSMVADNAIMMSALKKAILIDVYYKGTLDPQRAPDPTRNAALAIALAVGQGQAIRTNEELGQDLRAFAEGVRLVESGFERIVSFKSPATGKNKNKNPAR